MNKQDLDALANLYEGVYYPDGVEQLDEITAAQQQAKNDAAGNVRFSDYVRRGGDIAGIGRGLTSMFGSGTDIAKNAAADKATEARARQAGARAVGQYYSSTTGKDYKDYKTALKDPKVASAAEKLRPAGARNPPPRPGAGSGGSGGGGNQPLAKTPPVSSTVLAKKGGVEGKLDKATGKFTAGAFSGAEKSRYASVAARSSTSATSPSATSSSAPKPPTPATGMLDKTSFERRTPTSAELKAAQQARASGASPEQALQRAKMAGVGAAAAAKPITNQTSTAFKPSTPALTKAASTPPPASTSGLGAKPITNQTTTAFNSASPDLNKTVIATQQKKNTPPTTMKQSYEWPSGKTIKDLANAYSSIYEAKKKVDQDEDGDNDFADVRIARMVASGVPKEVAVAKTKNKSYNKEEFELDEATAMAKRGYDEAPIRQKIAASTGGGKSADRATALEDRPTYGDTNKQKQRQRLARSQRGDFRKTTSSNPGLHGYAHKSDDPAVKAKQAARGAQRGRLTPAEKKKLGEDYEIISLYLLENNFAETQESANVIIENMSDNWIDQILDEGRKPLPIAKMKRKEEKLLDNDQEVRAALETPMGSPQRKAAMRNLERFDNINTARTSISKRGGKQHYDMPEVGRYKPKDED